jgi:hypothetical protein
MNVDFVSHCLLFFVTRFVTFDSCSDAPALSNDPSASNNNNNSATASSDTSAMDQHQHPTPLSTLYEKSDDPNSEWDDTAVVSIGNTATTTSLVLEATTTATSELGSLSLSSTTTGGGGVSNIGTLSTNDYDDTTIAEKLRVEETRTQLANARIGMERQAAAVIAAAAEKEEKKAVTTPSTGGRWVPAHLRNQTAAAGRGRFGNSNAAAKLDVASNELFPDLQSAVDHIETEKQTKQSTKTIKVSMKKIVPSLIPPSLTKKKLKVPTANNAVTKKTVATTQEESVVAEALVTAAAKAEIVAIDEPEGTTTNVATTVTPSDTETTTLSTATTDEVVPVETNTTTVSQPVIKKATTTIKKKKKDLSTFKASS